MQTNDKETGAKAGDGEVDLYWSKLSTDILDESHHCMELLKEVIGLWLPSPVRARKGSKTIIDGSSFGLRAAALIPLCPAAMSEQIPSRSSQKKATHFGRKKVPRGTKGSFPISSSQQHATVVQQATKMGHCVCLHGNKLGQ